MASRMDEFRDFVARYPGVKDDVLNGTYTWQKVYENWVILGEGDQCGRSTKQLQIKQQKRMPIRLKIYYPKQALKT